MGCAKEESMAAKAEVEELVDYEENGRSVRPSHLTAIRGRIQDWGLKRAIYWQIMHTLARYLGIELLYVRVSADRDDLQMKEPIPVVPVAYRPKLATKEDLLPYVGKIPHLDEEFVDSSFDRGDICVAVFYEEQLVHFAFSTRVRARVTDQLEVIVPPGFRYGYKSWTDPEHRRRQVSRLAQRYRTEQRVIPFDVRGIHMVATHNYPSLMHGYRHPSRRSIPMGFVGWVTLFGRQYPFASRHAKWIGFEFVRKGEELDRQYVN